MCCKRERDENGNCFYVEDVSWELRGAFYVGEGFPSRVWVTLGWLKECCDPFKIRITKKERNDCWKKSGKI